MSSSSHPHPLWDAVESLRLRQPIAPGTYAALVEDLEWRAGPGRTGLTHGSAALQQSAGTCWFMSLLNALLLGAARPAFVGGLVAAARRDVDAGAAGAGPAAEARACLAVAALASCMAGRAPSPTYVDRALVPLAAGRPAAGGGGGTLRQQRHALVWLLGAAGVAAATCDLGYSRLCPVSLGAWRPPGSSDAAIAARTPGVLRAAAGAACAAMGAEVVVVSEERLGWRGAPGPDARALGAWYGSGDLVAVLPTAGHSVAVVADPASRRRYVHNSNRGVSAAGFRDTSERTAPLPHGAEAMRLFRGTGPVPCKNLFDPPTEHGLGSYLSVHVRAARPPRAALPGWDGLGRGRVLMVEGGEPGPAEAALVDAGAALVGFALDSAPSQRRGSASASGARPLRSGGLVMWAAGAPGGASGSVRISSARTQQQTGGGRCRCAPRMGQLEIEREEGGRACGWCGEGIAPGAFAVERVLQAAGGPRRVTHRFHWRCAVGGAKSGSLPRNTSAGALGVSARLARERLAPAERRRVNAIFAAFAAGER